MMRSWPHKLWGLLLTSASPCGLLMWGNIAGGCKEKTRRLRCCLHFDATRWGHPRAWEMMNVRNCGENLEPPSVLVPVRGTLCTSEKNVKEKPEGQRAPSLACFMSGEPTWEQGPIICTSSYKVNDSLTYWLLRLYRSTFWLDVLTNLNLFDLLYKLLSTNQEALVVCLHVPGTCARNLCQEHLSLLVLWLLCLFFLWLCLSVPPRSCP